MTLETAPKDPTPPTGDDQPYRVRPFAAGDRDALSALTGWPDDRDAWLDWWAANPFVAHDPMAVVERVGAAEDHEAAADDRELVGALPFFAIPVRAGDEQRVTLVPGPIAVAPGEDTEELRRRALDGAIDYYAAAAVGERPPTDVDVVTGADVDVAAIPDPPSFVAVPSTSIGDDQAKDEREDEGWQTDDEARETAAGESDSDEVDEPTREPGVSEAVRWDRIQRHGALLARRLPLGGAIGAPVSLLSRPIRRWRDGRASFDTDDFVVTCHDWVPDATMAAGYAASAPASTHVALTEPFLDWWYRRPGGPPTTSCVAYRGQEVAAALVAERETVDGVDAVTVRHVVPLSGDPARPAAVAAVLNHLLAEHRDADVVRITSPAVPRSVLDAYGFRRPDSLPTSLFVAAPTETLELRPVVAGERTVGGRPVSEAATSVWSLL